MRRRLEVFPRWQSDAFAVYVLSQAGMEQEAAEYASQLFKRLPADSFVRGLVLSALGRFDEALAKLERIPPTMRSNLIADSMLDPIRDDPRFHLLIAKLGMTEDYKTARETLARMQREQAGKNGQKTEVRGQRSETTDTKK